MFSELLSKSEESCLSIKTKNSKITDIVGSTAKGQISKRVFQENKACQIFRKTAFLTPWYAHVRTSLLFMLFMLTE